MRKKPLGLVLRIWFYQIKRKVNELTICAIFGHKENKWARMMPVMVPLLPEETPPHYYVRCDRCNTIMDDLGRDA